MCIFCRSLFVLLNFFLLAIVLPVLRFTDSDYPFGIFKLSLYSSLGVQCQSIHYCIIFLLLSLSWSSYVDIRYKNLFFFAEPNTTVLWIHFYLLNTNFHGFRLYHLTTNFNAPQRVHLTSQRPLTTKFDINKGRWNHSSFLTLYCISFMIFFNLSFSQLKLSYGDLDRFLDILLIPFSPKAFVFFLYLAFQSCKGYWRLGNNHFLIGGSGRGAGIFIVLVNLFSEPSSVKIFFSHEKESKKNVSYHVEQKYIFP